MNKNFKINLFLFFFTLVQSIFVDTAYSSSTILSCKGNIPKKVACLIPAKTYKTDIKRIDLCQNNPFPNFRSTPDFNAGKCIQLSNLDNSTKIDINKKLTYLNTDNIGGQYKYISLIFLNKFSISGQYNAGDYSWVTSKKGPKYINKSKDNIFNPEIFTTRLTSWRGKRNLNNKYCENGGTPSRCNLNYNGQKLIAIGLNSEYIETSGKETKYVFFTSELNEPINLSNNLKGYIEIKLRKNLEVFGNGSEIKSISIAPFLINTKFISDQ